jgi:hypothetical protein
MGRRHTSIWVSLGMFVLGVRLWKIVQYTTWSTCPEGIERRTRKKAGDMMRKRERIRGEGFKRLHNDITDRMRQSKRPVCDGFERIW